MLYLYLYIYLYISWQFLWISSKGLKNISIPKKVKENVCQFFYVVVFPTNLAAASKADIFKSFVSDLLLWENNLFNCSLVLLLMDRQDTWKASHTKTKHKVSHSWQPGIDADFIR